MPSEVLFSLATILLIAGKSMYAACIVITFCGCLGIGESLALTGRGVICGDEGIFLILKRTKRGLEEKVLITNPLVLAFFKEFWRRHPPCLGDRVFPTSYATIARWMR